MYVLSGSFHVSQEPPEDLTNKDKERKFVEKDRKEVHMYIGEQRRFTYILVMKGGSHVYW